MAMVWSVVMPTRWRVGKRPLSSMSPTIVLDGDQPWLVTGSPGGSRIISTVLQVIVNTVDFGLNVAEASAAPRIHHQWLPDELRVERSLSPDTIKLLKAKGHNVQNQRCHGRDPKHYEDKYRPLWCL